MTKMVFWNCPIIPHNRSLKNKHQNTAERLTVLGQFCKLIPKYGLAGVCSELNKEGIKIVVRAFSILVAAGVLVLIIYYWIVSGLIDTCAFACRILNRVIIWPFRALGRLISLQKTKKDSSPTL